MSAYRPSLKGFLPSERTQTWGDTRAGRPPARAAPALVVDAISSVIVVATGAVHVPIVTIAMLFFAAATVVVSTGVVHISIIAIAILFMFPYMYIYIYIYAYCC